MVRPIRRFDRLTLARQARSINGRPVPSLCEGLRAGSAHHRRSGPTLRGPSGEFRAGDKAIQLRNDYDKNLFNGDIGMVVSVNAGAGTLIANFDGARHEFDRGALGNLALAYAISIHKSQGSEYPAVIIPLLKAHFVMCYSAISSTPPSPASKIKSSSSSKPPPTRSDGRAATANRNSAVRTCSQKITANMTGEFKPRMDADRRG